MKEQRDSIVAYWWDWRPSFWPVERGGLPQIVGVAAIVDPEGLLDRSPGPFLQHSCVCAPLRQPLLPHQQPCEDQCSINITALFSLKLKTQARRLV
jgi:hypothetical protein